MNKEVFIRSTTRNFRIVQTEGNSQVSREIVYDRADHTKQNMELTTWKNEPNFKTYIYYTYADV